MGGSARRPWGLVLAVLLGAAAACSASDGGSGDGTSGAVPTSTGVAVPSPPAESDGASDSPGGSDVGAARAIPTPQDLADTLLVASEMPVIGGLRWSWVPAVPGGPGVVPDGGETPHLPVGNCGASDTNPEPAWRAYAVFSGEPTEPGVVSVPSAYELLFADEPAAVEEAFQTLRDAWASCVAPEQTVGEGSTSVISSVGTFALPAVGDDRFGVVGRAMSQSGGTVEHSVLIRQGQVLAAITFVEVGMREDRGLSEDEIAQMVEAVAARLP
jgi:hypothetical protein